jgi:hypothetical protein
MDKRIGGEHDEWTTGTKRTVLHFGIGQTIADAETGQVELYGVGEEILVTAPHAMGNRRRVVSAVAFAHDEQGIGLVLWVGLEKGLQKVISIFGDHGFIAVRFLSVRKAHAGGLIDP